VLQAATDLVTNAIRSLRIAVNQSTLIVSGKMHSHTGGLQSDSKASAEFLHRNFYGASIAAFMVI